MKAFGIGTCQPYNVLVQRFSLHPRHQHHREALIPIVITSPYTFFYILEVQEVRRAHIAHLLHYLPFCLSTTVLILREALQGKRLASLWVLHLEHHGKIAAGHHRFRTIHHGAETLQFLCLKTVSKQDRLLVLGYIWIFHRLDLITPHCYILRTPVLLQGYAIQNSGLRMP